MTAAKRRILIRQQKKWSEVLLPFEATNRYELFNEDHEPIGSAAEEGGGFGRAVGRQFLGSSRKAILHIYNQDGEEIGQGRKPFRWYFQRMEVIQDRKKIGAVERKFSLLHRKFVVENGDGEEVCQIFSPWLRIWTFKVMFGDTEVGRITKRWGGLLREGFTDADTFGIEYDALPDLETLRPVLIVAAFLIDFTCFENNNRGGGVANLIGGGD